MLHVLIGEDEYLRRVLKATSGLKLSWVVPKSAKVGDEALLFFPGESALVATARIASPIAPGKHGKRDVYVADISQFARLAAPVTLDALVEALPEWKWPTYPRSYTTVKDSVEEQLRRLLQGDSAPRTTTLKLVSTPDDVRETIRSFNAIAPEWPHFRRLINTTHYWVFDPQSGQFGPSKFVGFAGIDRDAYDAALANEAEGDRFDGNTTRRAIERVLRSVYAPSPDKHQALHNWARKLLGETPFEGIDEGKWQFMALPEGPQARNVATNQPRRPYRPVDESITTSLAAPHSADPDEHQSTLYVAEVKSISNGNEPHQLRLGLGQVLQYRHQLARRHPRVTAVLVPESKPQNLDWLGICADLGVRLLWPGEFDALST